MRLYQVLPVLLAVTAAACSDSNGPDEPGCADGIRFGVTEQPALSRAAAPSPDALTLSSDTDTCTVAVAVEVTDMCDSRLTGRAAPVTGVDGIGGFSVYAFYHPSESGAPRPFFADERAVRSGDTWATTTLYYWPTATGSTLDFWAMAGADAQGVTVSGTPSSIDDMAIDYTVPSLAGSQADLMIATTDRLNTPGVSVPLRFRHICSAVRFVFGDRMQPGIIKEITLSGIMSAGRYTTQWTGVTDARSFTVNANRTTTGNETSGDAMLSDDNTFMMIPQQLADDAMLTVVFRDDVTGSERTLTASLAGATWRQGTVTTYRIGISPEYQLEFTRPVETQDAHYVICDSEIKISGLPAGRSWTLTAQASDGADVSVQRTADINPFAAQGFWTDKEMNNGTPTGVSARGTKTVTGSGSGTVPLTVFLPENATDADRTVTLTLSVDGMPSSTVTQTITQVCPSWSGNTGWERIDDGLTGVYGFKYSARHVYIYNYWSYSSVIASVESSVSRLIEQYGASSYVTYARFTRFLAPRNRLYVSIEYSKLSNLNGQAASSTAGFDNTRQLYELGGSATSRTFENALLQLKKIQNGDTAFRKRNNASDSPDPDEVPKWIDGTNIDQSQALTLVLKKNRYYLNRYTDSETGLKTTAPRILAEDIVWYLPAWEQFAGMPASSFMRSEFWSSTAYGDATQSYDGSGALRDRMTLLKIRVARNR